MSFNLRVQIPLNFFQPQISAVFKYFSIHKMFLNFFNARVQMKLNYFECPSLGLDIYFSARVQVSTNFFQSQSSDVFKFISTPVFKCLKIQH